MTLVKGTDIWGSQNCVHTESVNGHRKVGSCDENVDHSQILLSFGHLQISVDELRLSTFADW